MLVAGFGDTYILRPQKLCLVYSDRISHRNKCYYASCAKALDENTGIFTQRKDMYMSLYSLGRIAPCLATALIALLGTSAFAQQGPDANVPRHGPPPEAIAACKGKASGATCSFTGRQNESLTGTCFSPPAGGPPPTASGAQASTSRPAPPTGQQGNAQLACRPKRGGPGGDQPPPR